MVTLRIIGEKRNKRMVLLAARRGVRVWCNHILDIMMLWFLRPNFCENPTIIRKLFAKTLMILGLMTDEF